MIAFLLEADSFFLFPLHNRKVPISKCGTANQSCTVDFPLYQKNCQRAEKQRLPFRNSQLNFEYPKLQRLWKLAIFDNIS